MVFTVSIWFVCFIALRAQRRSEICGLGVLVNMFDILINIVQQKGALALIEEFM